MSENNDRWIEERDTPGPTPGAVGGTADPMELWEAVSTTDPAYVKDFQRQGGFRGTAIDPLWRIRRLTEVLGPAGIGFGWRVLAEGIDGTTSPIHWCRIEFWYRWGTERGSVESYGCTPYLMERKSGTMPDEEARKKSLTDAIVTAMSRIGVSADVYLGEFDGDKYGRAEAPQRPQDARQAPGRPPAPPASQGAPRAQGKGGPEQRCPQCGTQGRQPRNFDPASNRPDLECPGGCKGNAKQDGNGHWPLNWWSYPKGTAPAVQAAIGAQAPPADGDPDAWRSGPPQEW